MAVWSLSKPTIAAVRGWCLAGACELAMACDMIVAAEDARFGEPEIRYGSGPVTLLMPFVLGQNKIKLKGKELEIPENNMLLRGLQFLAPENVSYGRFCWNEECQYCRVTYDSGEGTKQQLTVMLRVAFEVDDWDPATGVGWSVVIKGVAEEITSGIDPFAMALRSRRVVSLAPGVDEYWIAVYPGEITGRRFGPV